jgi:hypothetical protein
VWKNYKKVAGHGARNMAVNVAMKKKVVAVKGPQVSMVFARSGSECLQGSGNMLLQELPHA